MDIKNSIDNREVVFMYSKHGGLIELLSEE